VRTQRLISAAALSVMAFATVAVAPAGATLVHLDVPDVEMRGDTECDPGHEWAVIPDDNWDARVTHAKLYEHYTGGSGSYTKTATHQETVSAGISMSAEASINKKLVFAELEAKVGFSLAVEGARTSTTSVEVTEHLTKNDTYIFFAGAIKYSGPYSYYRCNSNGTPRLVNSGSVTSWKVDADGAVGCTQEVPSTTVAAKAKAQYCRDADANASVRVSDRVPDGGIVKAG
jgi:hypothetical protein